MCLNDIKTRVQSDIESELLRLLVGDHLRKRLQGLSVDKGPEAIVALMEEVWQHRDDEDSGAVRGQVDDARLLQVLGIRVNGSQRRLRELKQRVGLDY